jgi:hypothetical protein
MEGRGSMSELLMIIIMSVSGALFALGGTEIPYFKTGFKWLRRFVLPLFLALGCVLSGVSWWQASIYALLLCASLHMGYGERASYLKKFLIFVSYSGVSAVIGLSWWLVITPVVLILLFAASNWKPMASSIFWKAAEFVMGTLIAISLIAAINNKYF